MLSGDLLTTARNISLSSHLHYLRLTVVSQQATEGSIQISANICKPSSITARVQHLYGDDLDLTIDSFSGSVPLDLCEGSMLRKALLFVSIVLKLSLSDISSPLTAKVVRSKHNSVALNVDKVNQTVELNYR